MFVKEQAVRNFIYFYPLVEEKPSLQFDVCTRISVLIQIF